VKRREFITLLGGAMASPIVASAQQAAIPVIGVLLVQSRESLADALAAFHRGLNEAGYVEPQSVAVEYRSRCSAARRRGRLRRGRSSPMGDGELAC
jgi:putative ABC transport system substrate-binding protein